MSKKIIGIDLGTSTSSVAVIEGGVATIIPNSEGKRTTPSIIGFTKDDRKVGDSAKRQAVVNPTQTIYAIKRLMGKTFDEAQHIIKKFPYVVKKASNGLPVVVIEDREYTPQEISAMILQKMKKTAEDYLGSDVTEAVITVPAYFDDAARTATMEAGSIAGLKVLRIINEPTAAALAYGVDKKGKDGKFIVFDIGGGTHDVSLLDVGDGVFEVKATDGDSFLGGEDYDQKIIDWTISEFKNEFNHDIKDPAALQRIKEAAEKAKVELSGGATTEINLPYLDVIDNVPRHFVKTLSRAKFEQLTADLTERTMIPLRKVLESSGTKPSEIDEIILVGGSSRIPAIQSALEKFFGKAPNKSINPDEAVALGASIQGGILSGSVKDIILLDVIPLSLGIETMGGVFTKMIDANTTIPTDKEQVYSTASDNQTSVELHILQGERPMAKDNKSLGRFNLDGIPMQPKGVPQINVKFSVDSNGVLVVTAKDKTSGKEQTIRIEGSSNLDEADLNRMREEAKTYADADKKALEEIKFYNDVEAFVFSAEKMISETDSKISSEDREKVRVKIDEIKKVAASKNYQDTKTAYEDLQKDIHAISEKMYANVENVSDDVETSDNINSNPS